MKTVRKLQIRNRILRTICVLFSVFLYIALNTQYLLPSVHAIDITYPISDQQAASGDIITSTTSKTFVRSNTAYDARMFGVLEDNPLAVYIDSSTPNNRPIITFGSTTVNVSDYNGTILPGNYITSSPIPGKGQKADQSGQVLGIATSGVTNTQKVTFQGKQLIEGQVQVALNITYADLTNPRSVIALFSAINNALFRNVSNPEQFQTVVRYIIAGFIAILAFGLGSLAFSRSVAKGIEAIGRNPLAKGAIQFSIAMQIVLTIVTTLAGLVLAFIVIRF